MCVCHCFKSQHSWLKQEAALNPSGCNLQHVLQSVRWRRPRYGSGCSGESTVALKRAGVYYTRCMRTGMWDILQTILNDNKCVDIFRPDALPSGLCGLWIKKGQTILKPWLMRSWRRFPQSYSSTCRKQFFLSERIKYFKTNNNHTKWYPFVLP